MATQTATQTEFPQTKMTSLDRIKLLIKEREEERTKLEEKFADAQSKYDNKLASLDYELETLRRVKQDYEDRGIDNR